MSTDSILNLVADYVGKLILELAGEELKERFKEPTSQELLLKLNTLLLQLDLESQLFMSRLGQLIEFSSDPIKFASLVDLSERAPLDKLPQDIRDVIDENRYNQTKDKQRDTFLILKGQIEASIKDISRTLIRIGKIIDRFSPILDVYEGDLLINLMNATEYRGAVLRATSIVLIDMANDRSLATLLEIPAAFSSDTLAGVQRSFKHTHSALSAISLARKRLRNLIRKTYPSIKDLPK